MSLIYEKREADKIIKRIERKLDNTTYEKSFVLYERLTSLVISREVDNNIRHAAINGLLGQNGIRSLNLDPKNSHLKEIFFLKTVSDKFLYFLNGARFLQDTNKSSEIKLLKKTVELLCLIISLDPSSEKLLISEILTVLSKTNIILVPFLTLSFLKLLEVTFTTSYENESLLELFLTRILQNIILYREDYVSKQKIDRVISILFTLLYKVKPAASLQSLCKLIEYQNENFFSGESEENETSTHLVVYSEKNFKILGQVCLNGIEILLLKCLRILLVYEKHSRSQIEVCIRTQLAQQSREICELSVIKFFIFYKCFNNNLKLKNKDFILSQVAFQFVTVKLLNSSKLCQVKTETKQETETETENENKKLKETQTRQDLLKEVIDKNRKFCRKLFACLSFKNILAIKNNIRLFYVTLYLNNIFLASNLNNEELDHLVEEILIASCLQKLANIKILFNVMQNQYFAPLLSNRVLIYSANNSIIYLYRMCLKVLDKSKITNFSLQVQDEVTDILINFISQKDKLFQEENSTSSCSINLSLVNILLTYSLRSLNIEPNFWTTFFAKIYKRQLNIFISFLKYIKSTKNINLQVYFLFLLLNFYNQDIVKKTAPTDDALESSCGDENKWFCSSNCVENFDKSYNIYFEMHQLFSEIKRENCLTNEIVKEALLKLVPKINDEANLSSVSLEGSEGVEKVLYSKDILYFNILFHLSSFVRYSVGKQMSRVLDNLKILEFKALSQLKNFQENQTSNIMSREIVTKYFLLYQAVLNSSALNGDESQKNDCSQINMILFIKLTQKVSQFDEKFVQNFIFSTRGIVTLFSLLEQTFFWKLEYLTQKNKIYIKALSMLIVKCSEEITLSQLSDKSILIFQYFFLSSIKNFKIMDLLQFQGLSLSCRQDVVRGELQLSQIVLHIRKLMRYFLKKQNSTRSYTLFNILQRTLSNAVNYGFDREQVESWLNIDNKSIFILKETVHLLNLLKQPCCNVDVDEDLTLREKENNLLDFFFKVNDVNEEVAILKLKIILKEEIIFKFFSQRVKSYLQDKLFVFKKNELLEEHENQTVIKIHQSFVFYKLLLLSVFKRKALFQENELASFLAQFAENICISLESKQIIAYKGIVTTFTDKILSHTDLEKQARYKNLKSTSEFFTLFKFFIRCLFKLFKEGKVEKDDVRLCLQILKEGLMKKARLSRNQSSYKEVRKQQPVCIREVVALFFVVHDTLNSSGSKNNAEQIQRDSENDEQALVEGTNICLTQQYNDVREIEIKTTFDTTPLKRKRKIGQQKFSPPKKVKNAYLFYALNEEVSQEEKLGHKNLLEDKAALHELEDFIVCEPDDVEYYSKFEPQGLNHVFKDQ